MGWGYKPKNYGGLFLVLRLGLTVGRDWHGSKSQGQSTVKNPDGVLKDVCIYYLAMKRKTLLRGEKKKRGPTKKQRH